MVAVIHVIQVVAELVQQVVVELVQQIVMICVHHVPELVRMFVHLLVEYGVLLHV